MRNLIFISALAGFATLGFYQSAWWLITIPVLIALIFWTQKKGQLSFSHRAGSDFQQFYDQFELIMQAARQLYTESETLKRIINEQAEAVQASSGANHEISSMVTKTAENAGRLATISESSVEAINAGKQQVQSMNESLFAMKEASHQSKTSIQSSLAELQEIVSYMKQIQTKTTIINEIAFQTKLLAFNASVEAARAGEHGKGFAVVASEMSSLANNSGTASQEIEKILRDSISNTTEKTHTLSDRLQDLITGIEAQIHDMESKNQLILQSFESMTSSASSTNTMSGEISSATHEQEIGVKEVLEALGNMDNISLKLTSIAESAFKTSFNLAEQTEGLGKKLVVLSHKMGIFLRITQKTFDFNAAINAHIDWKMKLSRYLENPDGSLKADHVCKDNACVLGKWIYGDGHHHRQNNPKLFDELRNSHAEFHKTAGEVIRLIDSRDRKAAEKLLSPHGRYSGISNQTVNLIKRLKEVVESSAHHDNSKQAA